MMLRDYRIYELDCTLEVPCVPPMAGCDTMFKHFTMRVLAKSYEKAALWAREHHDVDGHFVHSFTIHTVKEASIDAVLLEHTH